MNSPARLTAIGFLIATTIQISSWARAPLTFEERVKAQEAIERVYYNHRIWPKENPQPKPPFEEMVPREVIEAKVTDYLKKCVALDKYWQRPIQPEQLQAEMDRMAKGTKDPATLRALFDVMDNDPYLIAECLARPVLAHRLLNNWYAFDTRFHAGIRKLAERAQEEITPETMEDSPFGECRRITYRLESQNEPGDDPDQWASTAHLIHGAEEFQRIQQEFPEAGSIRFKETPEEFDLTLVLFATDTELSVVQRVFRKTPLTEWWSERGTALDSSAFDPQDSPEIAFRPPATQGVCDEQWFGGNLAWPGVPDGRCIHTAVWTGTEMIIWGGWNGNGVMNSGGRYSPATDSWELTSMGAGNPLGRGTHTAVWTGTEMIVWGGYGDLEYNTGGRYNPSSDTWAATSTGNNCPSARDSHTAVWTGTEMIVWGGGSSNTGGRYNPLADTWVATSTGVNCPTARNSHTAVWTGTEMIVWGGGSSNTGGRYIPASDSWVATSTGANCPAARSAHTAVWTGTEMIVWGEGSVGNTGGRYTPSTDSWASTSTGANCPSVRKGHTAVWSGTEMIVWGGLISGVFLNTGGRYIPDTDTWVATSTGTNCPTGRTGHTAVWTGTEMIVWGQYSSGNTGGRYKPSSNTWIATSMGVICPANRLYYTPAVWTGAEMIMWGGYTNEGWQYIATMDTWTATSTGANCPTARQGHTVVWTGTEMIVWGGNYNDGVDHVLNTGGRYSPFTNTWATTSTGTACPEGRKSYTAVWTGTEMVVWGGYYYDGSWHYLDTGGRYSPPTNTWAVTSTGALCPEGRGSHVAIWTGTEMIVWGGYASGYVSTGGLYNPATNTWMATSTGANCPSARNGHTAVWTGTEMIVWGGSSGGYINTGGRYSPSTNNWVATSTGANCPTARSAHTAVWTGTEMIIWGGWGGSTSFDTGGRYHPSANSWVATSTGANCPLARDHHTAVWTGTGMIVWGRGASFSLGGLYYPDLIPPTVTGASSGCVVPGVALSTLAGFSAYQWYRDSAVIAGATSQTYTTNTTGNHNYSVRVTNGFGCQATSLPFLVSVLTNPSPAISGDSSGCTGASVPLSTGAYSSYQWYVGGVPISGATSRNYSATTSGSYKVTVTNSNGCQGTSATKAVTFYPSPAPIVTGASSGCASPGVTLSTQTYTTYQWRHDSEDISGATAQSYQAVQGGTYGVFVTDSHGCQGISPEFSVTIHINPTPTITGPDPACNSGLLSTQAFAAYQWFSGGTAIFGATEQSYGATVPDSYTVHVTDANGCSGLSQPFVIHDCPCALNCSAAASSAGGHAPLSVNFSADATPSNCTGSPAFTWSFGDGGTSTEQNPSHAYASAGSFTWALTVSADDKTCTQTGTIEVSEACAVTCTATATPDHGEAPLAVAFAASATATNCSGLTAFGWTFGDGGTSTEQNPSHIFAAPGTFTWTLTVSIEDKTCSQTGTVTVVPPCVLTCEASATPDHGIEPLTVSFSGSATATNCDGETAYAWAFGDGESSTEPNPGHTYASPGTFTWTLMVTVGGVTCGKTGIVTVEPGLPGDGNGDGVVSIGEVQQAINMFLGTQTPGNGVDCNGDGIVSIGEVQKVINAFLGLSSSC